MLKVLLDDHPAGWSAIAFVDFKLKPGFVETMKGYPSRYDFPLTYEGRQQYWNAKEKYKKRANWRRPKCYCHGSRHEAVDNRCEDDWSQADTEYAYIIAKTSDDIVMYCCKPLVDLANIYPSVTIFRTFGVWGVFASVALDGPEPVWKRIQDILVHEERKKV